VAVLTKMAPLVQTVNLDVGQVVVVVELLLLLGLAMVVLVECQVAVEEVAVLTVKVVELRGLAVLGAEVK
jgi:hypothetical protein